ncbi:hypothetical protein [Streptomyces sp. 2A115]|uniref:hypothetical protein n=1 Tax=Streptomyces sp. 2A115 TaxID=3457439 RepID=UPI003FD42621
MSVLEFIASLKWPLTVVVLALLAARMLTRTPELNKDARRMFGNKNVRLNIAGQEIEMTHAAVNDSVAAAAQTDQDLIQRAGAMPPEDQRNIVQIRREAIEDVMRGGAQWGWDAAKAGFEEPPKLKIKWTAEGEPKIVLASVLDAGLESRFAHLAIKALTWGSQSPAPAAVRSPPTSEEADSP